MTDMESLISWNGSYVLNAAKSNSLGFALKQGLRDQAEMLLESDADEQLLINIAFSTKVKVHSLSFDGPADGRAPKSVRLFANRDSLGFEDVESMRADDEIEIEAEQLGSRLEIKFVKFQNVERLALFVHANQGDEDTSALSCLKLWGASVATTNMSDFKRVAGEKGEGE